MEYASTILFGISFVLVIAVYVIYFKGPALRKRSPFAQKLADARTEHQNEGRRGSIMNDRSGSKWFICKEIGGIDANRTIGSTATPDLSERPGTIRRYSQQNRFFGESRVTPKGTPRGTPAASRANSFANVSRNKN